MIRTTFSHSLHSVPPIGFHNSQSKTYWIWDGIDFDREYRCDQLTWWYSIEPKMFLHKMSLRNSDEFRLTTANVIRRIRFYYVNWSSNKFTLIWQRHLSFQWKFIFFIRRQFERLSVFQMKRTKNRRDSVRTPNAFILRLINRLILIFGWDAEKCHNRLCWTMDLPLATVSSTSVHLPLIPFVWISNLFDDGIEWWYLSQRLTFS